MYNPFLPIYTVFEKKYFEQNSIFSTFKIINAFTVITTVITNLPLTPKIQ